MMELLFQEQVGRAIRLKTQSYQRVLARPLANHEFSVEPFGHGQLCIKHQKHRLEPYARSSFTAAIVPLLIAHIICHCAPCNFFQASK